MRHKVDGRKLGRTASHRKAMLKNMACQLIKYEKIITTHAKAKELQRYVEPLIHRAKERNLHNLRLLLKKVPDKKIVDKLFDTIAPRYLERNGGYTRVIHLPINRKGDDAKRSFIALVDENK